MKFFQINLLSNGRVSTYIYRTANAMRAISLARNHHGALTGDYRAGFNWKEVNIGSRHIDADHAHGEVVSFEDFKRSKNT